MTAVFQALNDDTRRAILDLLRQGDLSAGAIAEHFQLGKPTVSHHLDLLKRAELVTSEKHGQFVIYSLSTSVLEGALQWLLSLSTNPTPHAKSKQLRDAVHKGVAAPPRPRRPIRVPGLRLATDS